MTPFTPSVSSCRFGLLFLMILIIGSNASVAQTPEEILRKTSNLLQSKKSIDYKAVYRMKFFSGNDTFGHHGKAQLMRHSDDSLFHGKIRCTLNDTFFKFYDQEYIYGWNKITDSCTRFEKKLTWAIDGNVSSQIIWRNFLEPDRIAKKIDPLNKITKLEDTIIDGTKCWNISVLFPDEEDFTEATRNYYIAQKDYMLLMETYRVKFQGDHQYNLFKLLSWDFDKVKNDIFSPRSFSSKMIVTDYVEPKRDDASVRLLDSGTIAPALYGKIYAKDTFPDTVDLKGRITVLDYWYMSCHPCIKAIPVLDSIQQLYAAKGVQVIGLNAYDNDEEGRARLPKFLSFNPMHYDILLIDKDIVSNYRVRSWPTIYIIDREGKIIHHHVGYGVNLFRDLSAVLDKALQ